MNQSTILGARKYRSLFDRSSDEFEKSSIHEKLVTLSSLHFWGLLDETIKDFKQKYHHSKDKYIKDSLSHTISIYLSHLKFGNQAYFTGFEEKSLKENYKDFKNELTKFAETHFSFKRWLESYLMDDENAFKYENAFFHIHFKTTPFEEILKERDAIENKTFEESYLHLYRFLHQNLIPDFKKDNFQGYQVDLGMSYQVEYLIKFYLTKPSKEQYFKAILYASKIIYLNQPPYHSFYLFRINFSDQKVVQNFSRNNKIGIHFHTKDDHKDFEKLQNELMPSQLYVKRWKHLIRALTKNDVVVLASYKNSGSKVGMIEQHTLAEKLGSNEDFYSCLPLNNVQDIDLESHPFIQTLLPSNVTLSPIKRKNYLLRKDIFPRVIVKLPFNEFDDLAYEIMVTEWLRSTHAPKSYQLAYQLLKAGGNLKDIDIYGVTKNGEKLIAQVSVTNNSKMIEKKIRQLDKYKHCKKVFFFHSASKVTSDYEIISLNKVISDLENDSQYKNLVDELR